MIQLNTIGDIKNTIANRAYDKSTTFSDLDVRYDIWDCTVEAIKITPFIDAIDDSLWCLLYPRYLKKNEEFFVVDTT